MAPIPAHGPRFRHGNALDDLPGRLPRFRIRHHHGVLLLFLSPHRHTHGVSPLDIAIGRNGHLVLFGYVSGGRDLDHVGFRTGPDLRNHHRVLALDISRFGYASGHETLSVPGFRNALGGHDFVRFGSPLRHEHGLGTTAAARLSTAGCGLAHEPLTIRRSEPPVQVSAP